MKARHGHWSGDRASPTYSSWTAMMTRCYNEKHVAFARYGGRGISVCDRWHIFDNFLADMGVRPENTSLDRRDTDMPYDRVNCRWATAKEQANNRRPRKLRITSAAVTEIKNRLQAGTPKPVVAAEFGLSEHTVKKIFYGTYRCREVSP